MKRKNKMYYIYIINHAVWDLRLKPESFKIDETNTYNLKLNSKNETLRLIIC